MKKLALVLLATMMSCTPDEQTKTTSLDCNCNRVVEVLTMNPKRKNTQVPQCDKTDVRERCINFSTWIQDNYSPNKKQGGIYPLSKGKYRKDFTDEIYTISQLYDVFNAL